MLYTMIVYFKIIDETELYLPYTLNCYRPTTRLIYFISNTNDLIIRPNFLADNQYLQFLYLRNILYTIYLGTIKTIIANFYYK